MSQVEFSILVPSVPSRIASHLLPLLAKLERQAEPFGPQVEILTLCDNKRRSIGRKRQSLLNIAAGTMVAFVDDDDDVSGDYVSAIMEALANRPDADVIVFNQRAQIGDAEPGIVRFGVELENTEFIPGVGADRKPWTCCPYRREIANKAKFPNCSYGEDAAWVDQAWRMVRESGQVRIDETLHFYRHSPITTEAAPDFVKQCARCQNVLVWDEILERDVCPICEGRELASRQVYAAGTSIAITARALRGLDLPRLITAALSSPAPDPDILGTLGAAMPLWERTRA